MFSNATSFNVDLSSWNMSSVCHPNNMFLGAKAFNQNLCSWHDILGAAFDSDTCENEPPFNMFQDSGCTYQGDPEPNQTGPYCASECSPLSTVSGLDVDIHQTYSNCAILIFILFPILLLRSYPLQALKQAQAPLQHWW